MGKKIRTELLRSIPKVDEILQDPDFIIHTENLPRWLYMDAIREEFEEIRRLILSGEQDPSPDRLLERSGLIERLKERIEVKKRFKLRRVINATGIIIHTNLGRAILAVEAADRLLEVALNYSNLEYDLDEGRRGSRHSHLKSYLKRLTGAEDALMVNNNAAAVLLALNTLARGREVIVSRGELIEIGGSFRIPDVMARSGAILREVGTTNKTHLKDYEEAIGPQTALLLKVHTSNYRIVGFSHQPSLVELVSLGKANGIPVLEDLGSGCLIDLSPYGLKDEPLIGQSVAAGADVVTFSGDKLLGGPQAGIIIGRRNLIELIDKNPLHRALRIDKFAASAMEATLRHYLEKDRAVSTIPVLAMISASQKELRERGERFLNEFRSKIPSHLSIVLEETAAQVGGGALPLENIPSLAMTLFSKRFSANELEETFRKGTPPIIGRIAEDRFLLDLRTVLPGDYPLLAEALENLKE